MRYVNKLFERFLEWSFQRNANKQFNKRSDHE